MMSMKFSCFALKRDGVFFKNASRREVCICANMSVPNIMKKEDLPDIGSKIFRGELWSWKRLRDGTQPEIAIHANSISKAYKTIKEMR